MMVTMVVCGLSSSTHIHWCVHAHVRACESVCMCDLIKKMGQHVHTSHRTIRL